MLPHAAMLSAFHAAIRLLLFSRLPPRYTTPLRPYYVDYDADVTRLL